MEKLKMHTPDLAEENYKKLAALFPNAVTETIDEAGNVVRAIDKDVLMQEINTIVVDGDQQRYQFTWPDKRKSVLLANQPIAKTLRLDKEKSVSRDGTPGGDIDSENIYIEGDNLDALKLLRETYLGKVKMIYIDPPYNTGNDFIYEDDFSQSATEYAGNSGQTDDEGNRMVANSESNGRFHTDWLNMIYPRLKTARDLLMDDGIIFISCDDNEQVNLKKICDEIFGEFNFVTDLIWQSTAGSNTGTDIVTVTENILVYTKNRNNFTFCGQPIDSKNYSLCDEYYEKRGHYSLDKLDRRRVGNHYTDALNFPITMPDGSIRYPGGGTEKSAEGWNYLWSKTKVEWGIKNGFIEFKKDRGVWNVYNKRYEKVDNEGKQIERTTPFRNIILSDKFNTAQGTKEIRDLFGCRTFDFPKPSSLVEYLLSTAVRKDKEAIILDFFSGSATTAHSVMKFNSKDNGNRKYILVQLPEIINEESESYKSGYRMITEVGEERIRRAGKKIKEETNADIDYGFRCFKVDSTNMKEVYYRPADVRQLSLDQLTDNIKEDRTPEDLLFQVMLDLGVLLSSKIEEQEIAGKRVFSVADSYLMACFDKDVTEDVVTQIAKSHPFYAVFRDSSMADDSVAANFEQIFATYSPETVRKVL